MKKIRKWNIPIPRPVKAVICAILALLLIPVFYIASGCPTLSIRQEFRRAERAHLVGPSTIVDILNKEYSEFDKMIVGETEYGIIFFGRYYKHFPYDNPFEEKQYVFTYVEKTDGFALAAAPNVWGDTWDFMGIMRYLPVYLFTDEQDSVRAEVEITVAGAYDTDTVKDHSFTETFQSEADRSGDGFFRFGLSADSEARLNALYYFSSATGGNSYNTRYKDSLTSIIAIVRLYDASGELIQERELTIYDSAK